MYVLHVLAGAYFVDTLQVSQGRDHPAIACSIDVNCVCNSSEMEEIIELYIVAGVEAGGLWGWNQGVG